MHVSCDCRVGTGDNAVVCAYRKPPIMAFPGHPNTLGSGAPRRMKARRLTPVRGRAKVDGSHWCLEPVINMTWASSGTTSCCPRTSGEHAG